MQSHCNNFLQTVDRALESQINWEHFTAKRNDHVTMVRPYPISVDLAKFAPSATTPFDSEAEREHCCASWASRPSFWVLASIAWTIPRESSSAFWLSSACSRSIPVYLKQFVFVQIGAPSRTHIKRYHDFLQEVEAEAERINRRFQTANWRPIVFRNRQHSHQEIEKLLPRRRSLPGDFAARWHEPCGQGVHRRTATTKTAFWC